MAVSSVLLPLDQEGLVLFVFFVKETKLDLEGIQKSLKVPVSKCLAEFQSNSKRCTWGIAKDKMNFPRTRMMIY